MGKSVSLSIVVFFLIHTGLKAQIEKACGLYTYTTLAGSAHGHTDGFGADALLRSPEGIAIDRNGTIYVTEYRSSIVRKITTDGMVTLLAGKDMQTGFDNGIGQQARFNRPHGVAVDDTLNVYVCDMKNHTIRKITHAGEVSLFAGTPGLSGTVDGHRLQALFNQPEAIAINNLGEIFIADTYNFTIRKISTNGIVSTVAGKPTIAGYSDGIGQQARFDMPIGLATDSNNCIYIADSNYDGESSGNCLIRKMTSDGMVTTLAGTPLKAGTQNGIGSDAVFNRPVGIATDKEGNVYVADTEADIIRKIDTNGFVSTIGGKYLEESFADGKGEHARFADPQAIIIDIQGWLYIADTLNDRIRVGKIEKRNK